MKILTNYDFTQNQLLNVALQNLATAPGTPVAGQVYHNTTDHKFYGWDGTSWVDISNIYTHPSTHSADIMVDGATNHVFTAADDTKLAGIATSANNYSHPTGDGNLHVPVTSTTNNGKVLTAGAAAGSLSWTTPTVGTVTSVTGTSPIVSSGGATPAISIPAATNASAGHATSAHITAIEANTAKVTNATHTGDVTGATALTIAANAVTLTKMADMATASLLGRNTAAVGDPEVLPVATVKTMLGLGTAAYTASTAYATATQGTTADGAVPKSTVTTANDFIVGTGASTVTRKTASEVRTILNVADGANNYTHPTTAGNIHVPTGGTSGQVVAYGGASGTGAWATLDMTYMSESPYKESVKVATTANLTATAVEPTLTNSGTLAALVINGVSTTVGDRILVKDQTIARENGIYTVTTVGSASVAWVLTRSADANTASKLAGAIVASDYDASLYKNLFRNTDTIGVSSVNWRQIYTTQDSSVTLDDKLVLRDSNGDFTAGTITAALTGNASTATKLATGRTVALTGDVTGTSGAFDGGGNLSFATTIANNVVTNTELADMAVSTIKGRATAGTGDPENLTATQVRTILNVADGANAYVHPSTDGSHHVPATSTTNNTKVLKSGATAGSEAWGAVDWGELTNKPSSTTVNIDSAVSLKHTQNTDTGTSSATFQVGTSGAKIKNNAGTELQVRNAADTDYADIRVKNLVVEGATTTINSNTVNIGDSNIELNSDITTNAQNSDGGITVKRLQVDNITRGDAIMKFNNSTNRWEAVMGPVSIPMSRTVAQKYVEAIGDGAGTVFVVDHGFNTFDLSITVRETDSPHNIVLAGIQLVDLDSVGIIFAVAPTSNQYTVTVIG